MIVFVVARTVPIISSNNGRQRSHIVGHVCLIFATIESFLLLAACCSVGDAIVSIGRQLFVSAFVFAVSFSSNYLANKQASN